MRSLLRRRPVPPDRPAPDPEPAIPEVIAGHRVLRRIASGRRRDLVLARSIDDPVAPPIVVAVARSTVARADVDRELVALARAQGDHVVPILDVATLGDGRVAVLLEHVAGDTLAALLRVRGRLALGEAVTVLVPIASTLGRLHAAGVAVGSLAPADVRFTAHGAPMLCGFGNATLGEPCAPEVRLAADPAIAGDRAALEALAQAVLGRVGGDEAPRAFEVLERMRAAPPAERGRALVAALFAASDGLPVRFVADEPEVDDPGPGVLATDLGAGPGQSPRRADPLRAALGFELSPVLVEEVLDGRPLRRLAARAREGAAARAASGARTGSRADRSGRRARRAPRPALLALGAGAVTAGAVWFAVPATGESVTPGGTASEATASPVPTDTSAPAPEATTTPSPTVVEADDPVATAAALLALRATCLRDLDAACLDDVDQPGAALDVADRAWIAAVLDGGSPSDPLGLEPMEIGAGQRLGGAAILPLAGTRPASLLLLQGEAGWRIRDLIEVVG